MTTPFGSADLQFLEGLAGRPEFFLYNPLECVRLLA
jgi:hypothetical protein